MSQSSVARRRRRSVESLTLEDGSLGEADEELYASTPKQKRRRVEEEDEGEPEISDISEDGAGSPEIPLLPDSYRRSPKGKGKAPARPAGVHQPGSIVRIRLHDFVTYSNAEFNPGPNLNMVIGPNGTGKSTLVCAICLGLGWKPDNLGRAKSIAEFVKHGAKQAEIEIELAAEPEKRASNIIVHTRIWVDPKKKAEYHVDGKKTTQQALVKLMRSFSIQVDNLCQFLPQDRVVEFAGLSPVKLLTETLQAAAPPQMSEWHEELKTMRKEQKSRLDDQQSNLNILASAEKRQSDQHEHVERLRERMVLQERVAALNKLKPFPQYRQAQRQFHDAKTRHKEAEKDLRQLQRQAEPNLKAEKDKEAYMKRLDVIVDKRGKLVGRGEQNASRIATGIGAKELTMKDCENELKSERKVAEAARNGLPKLNDDKAKLERVMQSPPEDVDFAAYNERTREKTREIRAIDDRIQEISQEKGSLGQRIRQREQIIERAESEKASLNTQAGQQSNKLRLASHNSHVAWEWIQRNGNRFQGEIYGPPIVSCSVNDPHNAAAVEAILGMGEMSAFTATSKEDYQTLSNALYGDLKLDGINLRQSSQPLAAFKPPTSPEHINSLGLDGWILDLIEGPEPVLAMLCDNRSIHATAFATRTLDSAAMDALKAANSPVTSWVTPEGMCRITRRREYGDKATSVQNTSLKPAKFFTDAPAAAANEDAELDERVTDAKRAMEEYIEQKSRLSDEYGQKAAQKSELEASKKAIEEEKARKQRTVAESNALPTKLQGVQTKIDEATAKIEGNARKRRVIVEFGDRLTLEKGQLAIDYANAVNMLRDLIVSHVEAQIWSIEAKSDLDKLKARTVEEKQRLQERQIEVAYLLDIKFQARAIGEQLKEACRQVGFLFDEDPELEKCHAEIEEKGWDPAQLEIEIESVTARLDMTDAGPGGQHMLREYEERAKKIELLIKKRDSVQSDLEELEGKIVAIRGQWEPRLDELVAEISEAFAENFGRIQCVGEVGVHKDEDFEMWAIQIRVKFRYVPLSHSPPLLHRSRFADRVSANRDNEPLSLLDAHRQSGGERAVSTIFYLMALQRLTRAPFRVVDEINQGMDPRNERLVHSRMVEIACGNGNEGGGSQYFLITPKLLPGLEYREGMKVLCIASGDFMPSDYSRLDFGRLARRAVEVRGGAA
ncbi:Structural maintenance of chromosomes protein 5 [Friedmanniomyces endolithicus]|nr:Structural maintenance of chromosomes protein 5 [Friedmanniomyces endolithicus]